MLLRVRSVFHPLSLVSEIIQTQTTHTRILTRTSSLGPKAIRPPGFVPRCSATRADLECSSHLSRNPVPEKGDLEFVVDLIPVWSRHIQVSFRTNESHLYLYIALAYLCQLNKSEELSQDLPKHNRE